MNELTITIEPRTTVAERIAAFTLQTAGRYTEDEYGNVTNCAEYESIAAAYFYQKASDYREVLDMTSQDQGEWYLMKISQEELARFPYLERLDSAELILVELHERPRGFPKIRLMSGNLEYMRKMFN